MFLNQKIISSVNEPPENHFRNLHNVLKIFMYMLKQCMSCTCFLINVLLMMNMTKKIVTYLKKYKLKKNFVSIDWKLDVYMRSGYDWTEGNIVRSINANSNEQRETLSSKLECELIWIIC